MIITDSEEFFFSCLLILCLYFSIFILKSTVELFDIVCQYLSARLELSLRNKVPKSNDEENEESKESISCIGFQYESDQDDDKEDSD